MIEFLKRTDHRNFLFNISTEVQHCVRELQTELEQRRFKLCEILNNESQQYYDEMNLLVKEGIEEIARNRHEWLGIQRIEREQEEKTFLEQKKTQREIENSEEIRHLESKKILLETKQAQLYQIKEKQMIQQKERQIEQMWLQAMNKYNEEKNKQEFVGGKLRKVVANVNQETNLLCASKQQTQQKSEAEVLRQEIAEEDVRAAYLDGLFRMREKAVEQGKKIEQGKVLRDQLKHNKAINEYQQNIELQDDIKSNKETRDAILNNLYQQEKEKIQQSVWQQHFMEHVQQEKQNKREETKKYEEMCMGMECVPEQRKKGPYNKTIR